MATLTEPLLAFTNSCNWICNLWFEVNCSYMRQQQQNSFIIRLEQDGQLTAMMWVNSKYELMSIQWWASSTVEKGVVSGGQALAGIILKIELFEEVKMKIVIYEWLRERPRITDWPKHPWEDWHMCTAILCISSRFVPVKLHTDEYVKRLAKHFFEIIRLFTSLEK